MKTVLSFVLAELVGGAAAIAVYYYRISRTLNDDSVPILFTALALLLTFSFGAVAIVLWKQNIEGRVRISKAPLVAGLIGIVYGMLPAIGFTIPALYTGSLWILVFGCPVVLPVLLVRKRDT